MENIVVATPQEVAVPSVDLAQLPIGSYAIASNEYEGGWKLTIVDDQTSNWLLEKLGKDPAHYIGVARQLNHYKTDRYAVTRVVVPRYLHQGKKWEALIPGYYSGELLKVEERNTIDELVVLRQDIPQPPLDVVNLPIGTCVEVMTTGSMLWLTVMPRKPYDNEDSCRVLLSSNSRRFYANPPGPCSRSIIIGEKFGAASFVTSVVVSYEVL